MALDCCNEHDIVAMKFTSAIAPLYEDLRQIAYDSETGVSGPALPVQLDSIVRQLVSVMDVRFQDLWV
ncbi:hypothetical protein PHISP_07607 [Aspergillus sp. HF37]|nr:hypothetical protein PHISP_07607 [Aspergillus sp. HF37]